MSRTDPSLDSFHPGARVLVVDADPLRRARYCSDLRRMGHIPLTLASGLAALESLTTLAPDALLVATDLPDLDGFAVCRTLKADERWQDLPCVLCVSGEGSAQRAAALDCGAEDCVDDTLPAAELRARLDRLLLAGMRLARLRAGAAALDRVLLDGDQGARRLLRNPGTAADSIADGARRVLFQEAPAQRPRLLLIHRCDGSAAPTDWLYRVTAEDSMERLAVPVEPPGCAACADLDGAPARPSPSWSNSGDLLLPEPLAARVGTVENWVRVALPGGVATAMDYGSAVGPATALTLQGELSGALWWDRVAATTQAQETGFQHTLQTLAAVCERDFPSAANHARRMNRYCRLLAERLGMPAEFLRTIGYSAQLHDVGKIRLPEALLCKTAPLSVDEFDVVKNHTVLGAELLGAHPRLAMGREIAAAHHERWDGTGYPRGVAGDEIPLAARIAALADVYDALRTRRQRREGLGHPQAVAILTRGDWRTSPEHFDPAVRDAFDRATADFAAIYAEG